jgi:flagellar hook-associated protein 2
VTFQRDGKLNLDNTKFTNAVSSNFNDIASLFAATARATDPQVSFVSSTSKTQEGTYAIEVTQLGTTLLNAQGTMNGAAATGSATTLRGLIGDASEGLTVNVSGGALGARGTVNFSLGYAAKLSTLLDNLLSEDGILAARTDGINSSIERLDTQTERLNARLTVIESRYRAQYSKLDVLLTSMSSTSNFLTQQIAALNAG